MEEAAGVVASLREGPLVARQAVVRRALLGLCAFAFAQFVASVVYAHVIDGYVGVASVTRVTPFVDRITAVDPRSPVARDGLRPGDLVDLARMSRSDRVDWYTYLKVGKRYDLPIVRAGAHRTIRVTMDRNIADDPAWDDIRWQFYIGFAGISVMLGLAGFLVLKRPDSPEVALVSAILVLFALGQDFGDFGAWDTMNDIATVGGFAVSHALKFAGLALLATYALRFARPPSRMRRAATRITYAVAALAGAAAAIPYVGYWSGTLDAQFGFWHAPVLRAFIEVAPYALPLGCALLAIHDARGAERSRIAWATGSLALLYVAPPAAFVAQIAGLDWPLVAAITDFSFPLAALGLTYALLGHRLLDIGFALNRASVFAAVSLTVVGAFTLAEWALGGWLASASRTTNVAVSAGLALALGLAIHPIHALTDRLVDEVFFRKRHEAEQALRAFAKEAAFITDPALVIERTSEILRARTDCTSADILLYDGAHAYGDVGQNDPALVTLRATRDVVALRGVATALHGEYCFPMSAGGTLIGALVIGPKRLGESFAPDERDAVAAVAHGVGTALALLGSASAPAAHAPAASLETLVAAIEALPDRIARTLGAGAPPEAPPPNGSGVRGDEGRDHAKKKRGPPR
jgi:hypothetical protein